MSRVTRKGQVTIPKAIREEMGIEPGDEVTFAETSEGIVLQKKVEENRFERWRGVVDTDESVEDRMAELRGRDANSN
jgi:antitoxin PrlF